MKINKTGLNDVLLIEPVPYEDDRGFFMRTFDMTLFEDNGIKGPWVQDNHSLSRSKYTLRGLHFILPPYTDGKLVRCVKGEVRDVVLDIRKDSKTFGKYETFILNDENKSILYIPRGFAHGFLTLKDNTEICYKHNSFYNIDFDSGIVWNDPVLNINWGIKDPIISEKDSRLMNFNQFIDKYTGL